MRKFQILMVSVSFVCATAFAQDGQQKGNSLEQNLRIKNATNLNNQRTVKKQNIFGKLDDKKDISLNSVLRNNLKFPTDEPITKKPEGNLIKNAYATARGFQSLNDYIYQDITDGIVFNIVETDTNLYLNNPISTLLTDSWLKLDKNKSSKSNKPDTFSVKLPTPIFETYVTGSDDEDSLAVLYLCNLDYSADGKYLIPAEDQVAKYSWDGDTLKSIKKYVLGLIDGSGNWYGYGDDSLVVFKQKDTPTTLPPDAKIEKFVVKYKSNPETTFSKIVDGAKVGDDYYIGGLYDGTNFFAKGHLKDGKIVFEKQYLGITPKSLFHAYYIPAKVEYAYNESMQYYELKSVKELKGGLIYSSNESNERYASDDAYIINPGKNVLSSNEYYKPELWQFKDEAYEPQSPIIREVQEYSEDEGYGAIQFTLALEDANGEPLDINKLYYQVFFNKNTSADSAPYTFTTDIYTSLTESLTEIPATFSDGYDFKISGNTYTVFINDPIISDTNVGIRALYKGGDRISESKIVWANIEAGIKDSTFDKNKIKSVTYLDLSGRQISNPNSGIYIRIVKFIDGTVKSNKIVI